MEFRGGGGNSLGLQNLWEGDVHLTGSTDDLTGGAVDPSEYIFLIVHCTGAVTLQESLKFGVGSCNGSSSAPSYDLSLNASTTGAAMQLSITMIYRQFYDSVKSWHGEHLHQSTGNGLNGQFSTTTPFSFAGCKTSWTPVNTFTGDLHVAVYGLKLRSTK